MLGDGAWQQPQYRHAPPGAGLTAISDNAFATNNAIESLTIPKTIATIGAGSSRTGWSKPTKLTISGNTLTSIGSKAFGKTPHCSQTSMNRQRLLRYRPTVSPARVLGPRLQNVPRCVGRSLPPGPQPPAAIRWRRSVPDYLKEGLYYRAWRRSLEPKFRKPSLRCTSRRPVTMVMTTAQMKSVADAVLARSPCHGGFLRSRL